MAIEQHIRDRVWALIGEGWEACKPNQHSQTVDPVSVAQGEAWLTSAQNVVHLICPAPGDAYRIKMDSLASRDWGYMVHEGIAVGASLLQNMLRDINAGCLGSLVDKVSAETFDRFLDHAQAYLDRNRKNEGGTIAGVVFEDSIRKICRKHALSDKGVKLDALITELTNKAVFTQAKAKRARAAGDVRTKATHAQWDDFDLADVQSTIELTRELNDAHLA
jgi:hypothetical protein